MDFPARTESRIPSDAAFAKWTTGLDRYICLCIIKTVQLKPIAWMGDSLERLRDAPAGIRADAGYQLKLVQAGHMPADFRPMPDVGPGVFEMRLSGTGEYRVFYVAKFEEAVYVLHCFDKKTRATRRTDIDLGQFRYKQVLSRRRTS